MKKNELKPINYPYLFFIRDVSEYEIKCNRIDKVIPFFLTYDKYLQEIKKLIVSDVKCPMLGGEIEPNLLKLLDDPIDYLKSIKVVEGVINN